MIVSTHWLSNLGGLCSFNLRIEILIIDRASETLKSSSGAQSKSPVSISELRFLSLIGDTTNNEGSVYRYCFNLRIEILIIDSPHRQKRQFDFGIVSISELRFLSLIVRLRALLKSLHLESFNLRIEILIIDSLRVWLLPYAGEKQVSISELRFLSLIVPGA